MRRDLLDPNDTRQALHDIARLRRCVARGCLGSQDLVTEITGNVELGEYDRIPNHVFEDVLGCLDVAEDMLLSADLDADGLGDRESRSARWRAYKERRAERKRQRKERRARRKEIRKQYRADRKAARGLRGKTRRDALKAARKRRREARRQVRSQRRQQIRERQRKRKETNKEISRKRKERRDRKKAGISQSIRETSAEDAAAASGADPGAELGADQTTPFYKRPIAIAVGVLIVAGLTGLYVLTGPKKSGKQEK